MEMKQMMAHLLAEVRITREEMKSSQEEMKAEIRANNKKFAVLRGTLVSRMDIHQARTVAMQEKMDDNLKEMKAKLESNREEVKAIQEKIECNKAEMKAAVRASKEKRRSQ
jgi:peptidoglycan hydrolase CwlO-like protein